MRSADGLSIVTKRPAREIIDPPQAKCLLVALMIVIIVLISLRK